MQYRLYHTIRLQGTVTCLGCKAWLTGQVECRVGRQMSANVTAVILVHSESEGLLIQEHGRRVKRGHANQTLRDKPSCIGTGSKRCGPPGPKEEHRQRQSYSRWLRNMNLRLRGTTGTQVAVIA
ncbi:unnamed protein product [Laminaria digitata]